MIKFFKELVDKKKYEILIGYSAGCILIIPLLINLFAWLWSLTGVGVGAVEGWLGYWGSYLGGVFSALGVIATTFLIVKRNEEAIETQDRKARDKEYNFYELNQVEEAHKILVHCTNSLLKLNDVYRVLAAKVYETMEYPIGKTMGQHDTKIYNNLIDEYRKDQELFSDHRANYYGLLEQFDYKITLFSEVEEDVKVLKASVVSYFLDAQTLIRILEKDHFKGLNEQDRDMLFKTGIDKVENCKSEYIKEVEKVKGKLKIILMEKVKEYKQNKASDKNIPISPPIIDL